MPTMSINSFIGTADEWKDRFWEKVAIGDPDECWIWNAARRQDGYGQFSLGGLNGCMYQAHRVSYILAEGEIPIGMFVRHKCDVRQCVNPFHLELGDHKENMRDMITRGRHGTTRLNEETVLDIRARHDAGESYARISRTLGVTMSTVANIIRRETWRHLP